MRWHGRWTPWGRHFIEMLHKYFAVYVILYISNTDFFQHDSFVSNCEACEMYISWLFLYTSATWEGYICLDIHIFTYFFCICFLQVVGEVIWHGRWCPLPHWEVFHWYGPKIIFCSMHTSYLPKNIFFQHHEFNGNCNLYYIYIPLWLLYRFSCIHAYVCLHFDIFTYFVWECLA